MTNNPALTVADELVMRELGMICCLRNLQVLQSSSVKTFHCDINQALTEAHTC
jgi:hypothetical protein